MGDKLPRQTFERAKMAVTPNMVTDKETQELLNNHMDKLKEEKGAWWARKVHYMAALKVAVPLVCAGNSVVGGQLANLHAADLIADAEERFPEREAVEVINELVKDTERVLKMMVSRWNEMFPDQAM